MNISEINLNTHFVQINLSDLLDELGEDEVKDILSSFSCPLNADVEKFPPVRLDHGSSKDAPTYSSIRKLVLPHSCIC